MESLGIQEVNGKRSEKDPRKIWQLFAENYHLFLGTPSGNWLGYEFNKIFGIEEKPNKENEQYLYDRIEEQLNQEKFLPRSLFERFNIEVLSTTDSASDSLSAHQSIRLSGWGKRIIPCFRPDGVTDLSVKGWRENLRKLELSIGSQIDSYVKYIRALEQRREYFKENGGTSTDHGVFSPYTHQLSDSEAY